MVNKNKRELPYFFLRDINQIKKLTVPPYLFGITEENDARIIDTRSNNVFFFHVKHHPDKDSAAPYEITRRPLSDYNPNHGSFRGNFDIVKSAFSAWQQLCDGYEELEDIFMDEEELRNEEELFDDLRILDEDADVASFSLQQQYFISEAIGRITEHINAVEEEIITPEQKGILIEELSALQEELPSKPKNGIMRGLAKVAAKAKKYSVKAGSFIMKEFAKELLKEAAKRAINMDLHSVEIWLQTFGEHIGGLLT